MAVYPVEHHSLVSVRRRVLGVACAIAANLFILGVFLAEPPAAPAARADSEARAISLLASRSTVELAESRPKRQARSTARRNSAPNDVPATQLPPTELVAAAAPEVGDGVISGEAELLRLCHERLRAEISPELPTEEITMRVFVMPDGHIGQGVIQAPDDTDSTARAVFGCVQALAYVQPAVESDSPIGSWQQIRIQW